jgi:hypothetical protein
MMIMASGVRDAGAARTIRYQPAAANAATLGPPQAKGRVINPAKVMWSAF